VLTRVGGKAQVYASRQKIWGKEAKMSKTGGSAQRAKGSTLLRRTPGLKERISEANPKYLPRDGVSSIDGNHQEERATTNDKNS